MKIDDLDIELSLIPLFLLYRASMEPTSTGTAALQLNLHGFERLVSSVPRILRRLEAKGYIAGVAGKSGHPAVKAYRATRRGRAELNKARAYIRDLVAELPRATPALRNSEDRLA